MSIVVDIQNQYNTIANEFDISRIRIWDSVKNFISNSDSKNSLFDVGCGNGKNMIFAYKDGYHEIYGIDISEKLVEICRKKNLDVLKLDILNLQISRKFQKILCIAVIHHFQNINDQKKAIINMLKHLDYNGEILISVWSYEKFNTNEKNKKDYRDFVLGDNYISWNNKLLRYYYIHNYDSFLSLFEEINLIIPIHFEITYKKQNWFCKIKLL